MTLKDKRTIQNIVDANGVLEGQKVCSVWQYDSTSGERLYAVFLTPNHDMYISPYVKNPVLLWDNEFGKCANPE